MKSLVQKIKKYIILVSVILLTLSNARLVLASEHMTIVPTNKVCMITNMLFPRVQIPVEHDGKTYYGCCENCKKTLSEDAASRAAVDPVSGKTIDKATAVIAARDDGSVVYFENKKNFNKFLKDKKN